MDPLEPSELRQEFGLYLAQAGSVAAQARLVQVHGADWLDRLRARWSGRIVRVGVARSVIEAKLGPPDCADADSIAYRLGVKPGYRYTFCFDSEHRWCWSGFEREGPAR